MEEEEEKKEKERKERKERTVGGGRGKGEIVLKYLSV